MTQQRHRPVREPSQSMNSNLSSLKARKPGLKKLLVLERYCTTIAEAFEPVVKVEASKAVKLKTVLDISHQKRCTRISRTQARSQNLGNMHHHLL